MIEFKTIYGESTDGLFEQNVNAHLSCGWKLDGPTDSDYSSGRLLLRQRVVREIPTEAMITPVNRDKELLQIADVLVEALDSGASADSGTVIRARQQYTKIRREVAEQGVKP